MIAPCLALAAAVAVAASPDASPAYAPVGAGSPFGPPPHPASIERMPPLMALEYQTKAKALQAEMHALKESSGGKLTREQRTYLHEKLVALLSAYRRDLQRSETPKQ